MHAYFTPSLAWFVASFFAINCLWSLPQSYAEVADECQVARSAILIASEIRGLKQLRDVPCRMRTKAQVQSYLQATIEKKLPADKIRSEEIVYKLIGLIPNEFAYVDGIIQMYTDQVGGYYDTDEDYYAMASWIPLPMQTPIAVHELTHALQDQHFQLDDFTDPENLTTDESLARAAVIEGDATAVMADYSRRLSQAPPLEKLESVVSLISQNLGGAMLASTLQEAPASLQAILIFPYISGLHFVHSRLRQGGYEAINATIKNPPRSTSEIIHPELYPRSVHPIIVKLQDTERAIVGDNATPVYSDTLGEFVITTLLSRWLSPREASQVSAPWVGDQLALFNGSTSDRRLLVWMSRWRDEDTAEIFRQALSKGYLDTSKGGSSAASDSSPATIGSSYRRGVEIKREGVNVRLAIEATVKD